MTMTGREHLNIAAAEARGYRRAVGNLTGNVLYDIVYAHTYMGRQLDAGHVAALAARLLNGLTDHLNDLETRPS